MFQRHLLTLFAFLTLAQFGYAQCIGGDVTTASGESTAFTCPGDGNDDVIEFLAAGASEETNYQFVATNSDFEIVGIPPTNAINFEGAGEGTCYVWGFAYTGELTAQTGDNVFQTQFSTGCWNLSKKAVKVVRSVPDAGTVALKDGRTEKTICTADGYDNVAVYTNTSSSNAAFTYVVTDDNNNVLAVLGGSSQNFEGVPAGTCYVWGVSYTGDLTIEAGDDITTSSLSNACFDLSDNLVSVTRTNVDGGTVSTAEGATSVRTTPGDGIADMITFAHETSSAASFTYVVTDANNKIIGTPPGNSVDFEGAGEGVCLVWGVSYTGELKYLLGGTLGDFALSTDCFEVSENFVEVTRSAAAACTVEGGTISTGEEQVLNRAVIANRASGTISVIDGDAGVRIGTYDMPDDGQPMYVVHNALNNTVLVGDYHGQVVAFDGKNFSVVGSVPAGDGVFHMWISSDYQQLWVNNELDKTVSVVNPTTLEHITTFSIPEDLIDNGFKPHDVIVDPDNSAAYVTMINGEEAVNYVVKYDATTFEEIDRAEVGADPHVSLTAANGMLYVASQGADLLQVLERDDLDLVTTIDVPNAHGLGMNTAGTHLYIGNISEGGTNATYVLDVMSNTLVGEPTDAPYAAPHNYAVGSSDTKLYVTHSGMTSYKVSMYELAPTPTLIGEFNTGMNPFGLVAYSFTDTDLAFCVGDGLSDAFDVQLTGNTGESAWVITDAEGNILGLPPGPPFDLEGAGLGTCVVWHLSSDGTLSGLAAGNNVSDLEGCYALSNSITVYRETPTGGTVALADGGTTYANCAGNIVFDVTHTATAPNLSYWYIITDNNDNILGWHDAANGNTLDLSGAPAGECHIWGWNYKGLGDPVMGEHISTLDDEHCESISENWITVLREVADGGMVSLVDGGTTYAACAGDIVFDVMHTTSAANLSYWYVITDNNDNILGWHDAADGNTLDLSGAPAGECHIWGWNYKGLGDPVMGEHISTLDDDDCESISAKWITVLREVADGGMLSLADGSTEYTACTGNVIFDVMHSTSAANLSYWYVITDNNDNILGWHNAADGSTLDLSGAPAGECHIWGWNYKGLGDPVMGEHISTLDDDDCESISANWITVIRVGTDGGTVTTADGATEVNIVAGDGEDDIITFAHEGASDTDFTYVITDADNNILGIPPGNSQNFEGAGAGVCLVWGLAYTGEITAQMGDHIMNIRLSSGCSDLSDNFITVNRTSALPSDAALLSTTANTATALNVFPNPVAELLQVRLTNDLNIDMDAQLMVFDVLGRVVLQQQVVLASEVNNFQLDVEGLQTGMYILSIENERFKQNTTFVKK